MKTYKLLLLTIILLSCSWVNAQDWVETQKGASPSVTLSGRFSHRYGYEVALDGNYAVVGSYGENIQAGSAFVYFFDGNNWLKQAKLTASDAASRGYFGKSVSISGDQIVVGADGDDNYAGSAYIFVKPSGGWADMTQTAKLTASDAAVSDYFGISVSISGDQVVVGAHYDDDGGTSSGSAYVFEKPAGGWVDMTQTAKLTASDASSSDYFGNSVSISGDQVVVGAHYDDDGGTSSGSAYVFEKPAGGTNG